MISPRQHVPGSSITVRFRVHSPSRLTLAKYRSRRYMPIAQRTVQVCLFILAAIALIGGTLQMSLGQPDTSPRLDNVHRFLAGIYLGCGFIAAWAAITIRQQGTLVYLIALAVA